MSDEPTQRIESSDETLRLEPTSLTLAAGQRVLNRYVLEAVLGQGGMGVVWRARDESLGETVALKVLPEAVARDRAAVEELKEETRRARRLTHPNIVRTHDFVEGEGFGAVSMEFIDGDTLANLRLSQPGKIYSVGALAPLAAQLCAALDYAHRTARVVHRDLKPANLLVTKDGQLKVADFGIARGLAEASVRLTGKAGQTSGTLLYASPQQLFGEKPTESDDIYALGSTLYELLTGKPPFYRGDAHILMVQVREKAPLPLAKQRQELELTGEAIPREWEKTILACLAKQPEQRPSSARDVAVKLGLPTDLSGGPAETTTRRPRVMPWAVGMAAAVVGVLGYSLWPAKTVATTTVQISAVPKKSEVIEPAPAAANEFVVTIDPSEADARVSVGANPEVAVKNGRVVLTDLADGEHDLVIKAAGYERFATRVTVKNRRGSVEVRLLALRGALELTARPGTVVTLTDASGKETRDTVGANGEWLVENLPLAGSYKLRLEHPECEPVERTGVMLAAEGRTKLTVGQVTSPGELRVFSVPAEADVRVDGKVVGKTPATLKNQPSGKALKVEIAARGYRTAERAITLRPKEVRTVNVGTLEATASGIEFRNLPAGFSPGSGRVLIDGREIKPTRAGGGWRIDGLESGARVVEVVHPDYEPWKQSVKVEDREVAELAINLVPKPASLTLRVTGASTYVLLVNEKEVPVVNGRATLPVGGPLSLRLGAPGYLTATRHLTAKPNGAENWDVTLLPSVPPQPGQAWTNGLGMKFVPVPGATGLFSVWITRVQDFKSFVDDRRRDWPAPDFPQEPTHPAVMVSWEDARAFCNWLTEREKSEGRLGLAHKYRLPTDAEWSAAAGLPSEGEGTPEEKKARLKGYYSWGTSFPPPKGAGNFAGVESGLGEKVVPGYNDGFRFTSPVGSFAPNRHGLFDMGGNVHQWGEDLYSPTGTMRVRRGTAFTSYGSIGLLLSQRDQGGPSLKNRITGFRCVLDLGAASGSQVANSVSVPTSAPAAVARQGGGGTLGAMPVEGQRWKIPGLNLELVPIAPGTFGMGSAAGASARLSERDNAVLAKTGDSVAKILERELPQTSVTLTKAFWLGKTEVTQREWQAIMANNPSRFKGEELPVEQVVWAEVMEFCRKLSERERAAGRLPNGLAYTLPTEAQWEYACRAGTTGDYSGDINAIAWYGQNSGGQTHPVAQKQANAWGLFDMHGNVMELCLDPNSRFPGGSVSDHLGQGSASSHTRRGGDYENIAFRCRSAFRIGTGQTQRADWIGFRVALCTAP